MNAVARAAVLTFLANAKRLGMTPAEAALIVAVGDADGPSLTQVSERLVSPVPTVSRTKSKLPGGLLVEDQSDGRTLQLYLSDKGREVLAQLAGEDDDL